MALSHLDPVRLHGPAVDPDKFFCSIIAGLAHREPNPASSKCKLTAPPGARPFDTRYTMHPTWPVYAKCRNQSIVPWTLSSKINSTVRRQFMTKARWHSPLPVYPYPDEIFYSILARLYHRVKPASLDAFHRWVFGKKVQSYSIAFPIHLGYFSEQLGAETVDDLINRHTLAPLWRPFLTPEQWQRLAQAMKGDGPITLLRRLTAPQSPRALRYCPTCVAQDRNEWNEAYWHRIHQAPGVTICPHHLTFLESNSEASLLLKYLTSANDVPDTPSHAIDLRDEDTRIRLLVAQSSAWLLNHRVDNVGTTERYLQLLQQKGWAGPGGTASDMFRSAVRNTYSDDIQGEFRWRGEGSVVKYTVTRTVNVLHPVHHILLLNLLGCTIDEFTNMVLDPPPPPPFGSGPWPCLNPVADHCGVDCIHTVTVSRAKNTRKAIGEFRCPECHFS